MPEAPSPQRRPLSFSLRAALIAFTAAAVASWVYWDGWPRYKVYREQKQFEAAAKSLKSGALIPVNLFTHNRTSMEVFKTRDGRQVGFIRFEWPSHNFYVVYLTGADAQKPGPVVLETVEVFKFRYRGAGYEAKTQRARDRLAEDMKGPHAKTVKVMGYWYDICEYLTGDRRDDLGLEFELIHADPPR